MSQGSPRCPSAGGSAADILQRQPGCVPAFVGAMSKSPDLLFIWDSQSLKAESDWLSLYQMLRHALPGEGGPPHPPRPYTFVVRSRALCLSITIHSGEDHLLIEF